MIDGLFSGNPEIDAQYLDPRDRIPVRTKFDQVNSVASDQPPIGLRAVTTAARRSASLRNLRRLANSSPSLTKELSHWRGDE
jgi:hypothetical protein